MASGKNKKNKGASALSAARADVVGRKQIPWLSIISVGAIVALAAVVFGYYLVKSEPQREAKDRAELAAEFAPSKQNQDPSKKIKGVEIKEYKGRGHVGPTDRVKYTVSPPMGGAHDGIWADCMGTVYDKAVRTENMVHTLEHGAVWIAYNPDKISDDGKAQLEARVKNKPFTLMAPYPGLKETVSVQAWGHQLRTDDAADQRIDNFIAALRNNQYLKQEQNATCQAPQGFDVANPPAFDKKKPGKGAKKESYNGQAGSGMESGGAEPTEAPQQEKPKKSDEK